MNRTCGLLMVAVVLVAGCDKMSGDQQKSTTPTPARYTYTPEDPKIVAARQKIAASREAIRKAVHNGLASDIDRGNFSHDLGFTNNSPYNLSEIRVKMSTKDSGGATASRDGYFGLWKRGQRWHWNMPAEKYQRMSLKGTAKLDPPVDGVEDVEIDIYWNVQE